MTRRSPPKPHWGIVIGSLGLVVGSTLAGSGLLTIGVAIVCLMVIAATTFIEI